MVHLTTPSVTETEIARNPKIDVKEINLLNFSVDAGYQILSKSVACVWR
jgi:hypothetical protein